MNADENGAVRGSVRNVDAIFKFYKFILSARHNDFMTGGQQAGLNEFRDFQGDFFLDKTLPWNPAWIVTTVPRIQHHGSGLNTLTGADEVEKSEAPRQQTQSPAKKGRNGRQQCQITVDLSGGTHGKS